MGRKERSELCVTCGFPETRHPVNIDGPGAGQQVLCMAFLAKREERGHSWKMTSGFAWLANYECAIPDCEAEAWGDGPEVGDVDKPCPYLGDNVAGRLRVQLEVDGLSEFAAVLRALEEIVVLHERHSVNLGEECSVGRHMGEIAKEALRTLNDRETGERDAPIANICRAAGCDLLIRCGNIKPRPVDRETGVPEGSVWEGRNDRPAPDSCCCRCHHPEHTRESYGEDCRACGKHRAPRGPVRWVESNDLAPTDEAALRAKVRDAVKLMEDEKRNPLNSLERSSVYEALTEALAALSSDGETGESADDVIERVLGRFPSGPPPNHEMKREVQSGPRHSVNTSSDRGDPPTTEGDEDEGRHEQPPTTTGTVDQDRLEGDRATEGAGQDSGVASDVGRGDTPERCPHCNRPINADSRVPMSDDPNGLASCLHCGGFLRGDPPGEERQIRMIHCTFCNERKEVLGPSGVPTLDALDLSDWTFDRSRGWWCPECSEVDTSQKSERENRAYQAGLGHGEAHRDADWVEALHSVVDFLLTHGIEALRGVLSSYDPTESDVSPSPEDPTNKRCKWCSMAKPQWKAGACPSPASSRGEHFWIEDWQVTS